MPPKPRQIKIESKSALAAMQQLESRSDEELEAETRFRAAAQAILGARAAERYDPETARRFFNEALSGCHPRERPALRQMAKASLALAERRPSELKEAVEKLGQEAPSRGQLMLLGFTGLIAPPPGSSILKRVQGILILILLVLGMLALGTGIAMLGALPFGGVDLGFGVGIGLVIMIVVLAAMALLGRRRQRKAAAARKSA